MISEVLNMDEVDRQIIQIIQEKPHLTHTQIAEKVNRSQPTVGMRIRKLEEMGVLQFQAGINIKATDMYLAIVEIQSNSPEEIFKIAKSCPFIFNCFRISGDFNFSLFVMGFSIKEIEDTVNYHFRNNQLVNKLLIEIITNVLNDFVVPIKFNLNTCECDASKGHKSNIE